MLAPTECLVVLLLQSHDLVLELLLLLCQGMCILISHLVSLFLNQLLEVWFLLVHEVVHLCLASVLGPLSLELLLGVLVHVLVRLEEGCILKVLLVADVWDVIYLFLLVLFLSTLFFYSLFIDLIMASTAIVGKCLG